MNTPPYKPRNIELPDQVEHKQMKEERSQKLRFSDPVSDFRIPNSEKENIGNAGSVANNSHGSVFDRIFFQQQ